MDCSSRFSACTYPPNPTRQPASCASRPRSDLRADSFGKLEVYELKTCAAGADKMKVQMDYARIYTFGGKMNDDEGKLFELTKTPAGWRIASEKDTSYGAAVAC